MLIRRLRIRCGDGSLYLLFPLALALQLFSELTEEEAITDATTILTIQAEAVKEKGPVAHFSVCLSCIPFNSATSKCVDNTTSLRVSSSLHMAAIALSWEAFTNVSYTIRISPFTACFLLIHCFIKPVPYWASTPVQTVPSRHVTFQFVFILTLQTLPCPAVLARFFEPV